MTKIFMVAKLPCTVFIPKLKSKLAKKYYTYFNLKYNA